ncbi:MAG: ribose-5-phosphate isomerase RpiA [Pyrinomonadaceae bacterium]
MKNTDLEQEKLLTAREAVKYVENDQTIGLGTGSTANLFIKEVGRMVAEGLRIKAVPTSDATARLAESLNIPLFSIDEVERIDLTIDGTDEFDGDLNLIKGGGGALFREKMVARLSEREIILADSSKRVERLGAFKIPVEVVPIALGFARRQIEKLGGAARLREKNRIPFMTDAGNRILDADFGLIDDVKEVSARLNAIEGVVCHGLFIGLAQMVIMAEGDRIIYFE